MKKLFCGVMSVVMAFGVACLTGCGGGGGNDDSGNQTGGRLTIEIYEAGFGTAWLDEIAANYSAATGIKVKVNKSYLETEIPTKLINDQSDADIVFMVGNAFEAQDRGLLVDLSDVLDAKLDGNDETVREKMNRNIYDYLVNDDGTIYQLPWANTVSSFCYNETTLNEILGEGNWTLPNTTDEFFALADRIKAVGDGNYAFVDSTKTGYGSYLFQTWWAQYDGVDRFYDYFNGYYYKDGVRTFAENGEIYDNISRLRSLEVCEKLFKKTNGYIHNKSDRMEFTDAQIVFAGQGFSSDKAKAAFIISGDWTENELISYLQAAEAAGKPQTIKMMKMPVISSIVETLKDTSMTDETLSAVIEAVDAGKSSYDGVDPDDFARIASARNTVSSLTYQHPFGIPSNSSRINKAKDFIRYMLSDYAQSIYAKNLNGLSMPYGYKADDSDLSAFVKSRLESYDNTYFPISNDYSADLFRRGRIGILKVNSAYIDGDLFAGVTAKTIFDNTSTFYKSDWETD